MALMDKFKDILGIPGEEDLEDDDEMIQGGEDTEDEKDTDAGKNSIFGESASSDQIKQNKVVNIHTTTQLQVVLVKPEHFDDARPVADQDVSRRLIDFLSGVAYANNGQIKRVANSTYIITPYNVNIMGDLLDELENSGVIF